jgi:hypothetical protein
VDALRRSPAFDTARAANSHRGDLLHIFDLDPNVLSKDAWRPRNHNCYRLGALGHGAGASSLRAAANLANAGCEPALMLAAHARKGPQSRSEGVRNRKEKRLQPGGAAVLRSAGRDESDTILIWAPGCPHLVRGMPLPDAARDISQHAPRSVREDAVVVIDVPNTNDAENDQKSQKHSHVYPRSVV